MEAKSRMGVTRHWAEGKGEADVQSGMKFQLWNVTQVQ